MLAFVGDKQQAIREMVRVTKPGAYVGLNEMFLLTESEALCAWRDLGLAWDEALCGLDMATFLDPADREVRAAAEAAREILVRLEAAPFIARLDAALARSSDQTGHAAEPTMAPSTPPRRHSNYRRFARPSTLVLLRS